MQGTVAGALPIIVTNYARAFGVVVRMQGMQAYTDGDVITIPRLDLKDPVKARLAYGYLAHEAAHVRYTDFSIVKKCSGNYLRSSILNILEDARVERLIGSSFIGVWENLELLRSYRSESWEQYKTKVGWLPLLQVILAFLLCYTGSYCQRFRILRDRAAFLCRILRARMSKHGVRRLARLSLRVLRCKNTAEIMRLGEDIISLLNTKGVFDPNNHKPIKMPRRKRKLSEAAGDTGALKRQRLNAELSRELYELQKSIAGDFSKLAPCSDPSSVLTDINEDSESARDDLGIFEVGVCRSGRPDFITKIESSARFRRHRRSGFHVLFCPGHKMRNRNGSEAWTKGKGVFVIIRSKAARLHSAGSGFVACGLVRGAGSLQPQHCFGFDRRYSRQHQAGQDCA